MATYRGTLEQAGDGSWTAAIIGEHTVLGTGDTRDEALNDLRQGALGIADHLRDTGEVTDANSVELTLARLMGSVMVMV